MFKKLVFFFMVFAVLISCDLFKIPESGDVKNNDTGTIDESTKSEQRVIIGRGYDVTGKYADSASIKSAILDFDSLYKDNMILEDKNIEKSSFITKYGTDIRKYQESLAVSASLSASAGVKGVASFSQEVGVNFSRERYENEEYAFATTTSRIVKKGVFVENRKNPGKLIKYVSEGFLNDINEKSAEQIIETYGTHVMLGSIMGARLDYNMSVKKKTSGDSTKIGVYASRRAEATIKGIDVSGETKASVDTAFSNDFETSTIDIRTFAYGGSSEFGQHVNDESDYSKWIDSIAQNIIWTDYYPDSLIPIYDFIEDSLKKEAVKNAYETYLEGKVINVSDSQEKFTVVHKFTEQGFVKNRIGGKDNDVGTSNGKETEYEFKIEIVKREEDNLHAKLYMRVKELKWNDTELEGSREITIPVNKKITSLDLNVATYTAKGRIGGQRHGWVKIDFNDCEFLPNGVHIVIDSNNSDDTPSIGITGEFHIPIHYKK